MEIVYISFKELYEANGVNLQHGGYIDFHIDGDSGDEYYDLRCSESGGIIACDGERHKIIKKTEEIIILECTDGGRVYLTKDEFDIAVFK